jgi:hypothetical protein
VKIALRNPFIANDTTELARKQQENNEDLLAGFNGLAQFIFWGSGVPTSTPPGPALYFRLDSPEVYKFNGAWVVA